MSQSPLGFNLLHRIVVLLSKHYFRAEIKGLENIPDGPCLFVGNHNAIAAVSPEIWIFGAAYFEKRNSLRVLGHDLILKIPGISHLAKKYFRYIPNDFESAKRALEDGMQVLVFPGGAWESGRPFRERDKIDFKGRTGFARLAREAGVPIIPVVSTGAHDGVYIWKRGEGLAKALGLKRFLRIDVFPLGLSFPFVFHIGPLFPFFPLPTKIILEFLPPIHVVGTGSDHQWADQIVASMQRAMDANVSELPRVRRREVEILE